MKSIYKDFAIWQIDLDHPDLDHVPVAGGCPIKPCSQWEGMLFSAQG